LWIKLQEKGKTATLHRKIANVLWDSIGDKKKAKEHHGAALRILETEPESAELARLYEDVAHMLRRMGQVTEALSWAEKALRLAEKLNALKAVADSCIELAMLAAGQGEVEKGLEYANRALRIALDNDYLETALMAYDKAGGMLPMEEYEKRLDYWEKGLALAKKTGSIGLYAYFLEGPALEYTWRGELSRALPFGEESVALAKKANDPFTISWNLLILGEIYQRLGEWEKSEQLYEEAMSIPRSQDEIWSKMWSRQRLAMLHADREEYTKARELLEETVKIVRAADLKGWVVDLSVILAWMLVELGETEEAQELLDRRQKFDLGTKRQWRRIEVMPYRAMLLRAQKKYAESIALFEETLEAWESIKADFWYAYWFARQVLCEYARACLERNEKGDRIRAGQLLNRALEMFQKMGAKKDIEKVEARIAFTETGKAVSTPKPIDHVSTGYTELDKLLYGGVPPNCAVVLTSRSCNERDLLVKSFIETGVNKGEVTFYITIDASAAKVLSEKSVSNLQLFVCNPETEAIIKSSPNVHTLKGVENLTDISIALTSAIRQLDPSLKGPRRICISLVSDVLLQHHAVETRRWLSALMTKLKSEGFTTLAVMDPEMHSSQDARAILDLFDGEININEEETEKGLEKRLKIKKMSNQEYLESELPLKKEDLKERK
jgi:tetratricopeptide (TPR) repeat protein/KaiC/GvpD/RAD55 family RecA-like ATPase